MVCDSTHEAALTKYIINIHKNYIDEIKHRKE